MDALRADSTASRQKLEATMQRLELAMQQQEASALLRRTAIGRPVA